jgi:putative mRNA 3-end processing factor
LTATIDATGAGEIWVTHGQEDALVHWCTAKGLVARPLDLVGYGNEDGEEEAALPAGADAEA